MQKEHECTTKLNRVGRWHHGQGWAFTAALLARSHAPPSLRERADGMRSQRPQLSRQAPGRSALPTM